MLVDGSGRPPVKADVIIRDEKILAIGSFPSFKADKIIFGNESYLCPGFIDINVSSDRYLTLFSAPRFGDFLLQGITSVLLGQCGFSLAPSFYGPLRNFETYAKTHKINANWKRVKEFLGVLSQNFRLGVNVGTLSGHCVMREEIVKDPAHFRPLTANELRVFRSVVSQAMKDGAFGISSGLGYFPYQETPYHELRALLDAVKNEKGVYATHLKNEKEGILDAVGETIRLSQETAITTIISHFRPFLGYEEEYEKALSLIEKKAAKANIYFDTNPFPSSAVSLNDFLPIPLQHKERETIMAYLNDKSYEKKIISQFPKLESQKTIIFNTPGMEFLQGKTLYEFARNRELSVAKALLELMKITRLSGSLFFENLNKTQIEKAIKSPRALISTNSAHTDALPFFKPPRTTDTFTKFFRVASSTGMTVEKAVAKITGLPAKILGMAGRGFVSDGYFADLVLLSRDFSPLMVMVNGKVAAEEGKIKEESPGSGKVLRKQGVS